MILIQLTYMSFEPFIANRSSCYTFFELILTKFCFMSFMNHENFHEPNFYLKSFLESSWKNKKMSDIFHSQKSFPHWASLMIDLWFPIKKKLPSRNENFSFEALMASEEGKIRANFFHFDSLKSIFSSRISFDFGLSMT